MAKTAMTVKRIAERLNLGTPGNMHHLLCGADRTKGTNPFYVIIKN